MKRNNYQFEADFKKSIKLDELTMQLLLKKSYLATCSIMRGTNDTLIHGSGFFCKIPLKGKIIKFLFTNNHVLDKDSIKEGEIIKCSYKNKLKKFEIKKRRCFTNADLDYTCIEILNEDQIEDFFEIENKNLYNPKEYNFEDIALPQYPDGGFLKIYSGYLTEIDDYQIYHYVTTSKGSSGSPIILVLRDFKILGIHCSGLKQRKQNRGILMTKILSDIEKVKR